MATPTIGPGYTVLEAGPEPGSWYIREDSSGRTKLKSASSIKKMQAAFAVQVQAPSAPALTNAAPNDPEFGPYTGPPLTGTTGGYAANSPFVSADEFTQNTGVSMQELDEIARAGNIDPKLLSAIMRVESQYNPGIISKDKNGNPVAYGLMQVTPATAKAMGWQGADPTELLDPRTNLKYGIATFRKALADAGGDVTKAAHYYHSGQSITDSGKLGPVGRDYVPKLSAALARATPVDWTAESATDATTTPVDTRPATGPGSAKWNPSGRARDEIKERDETTGTSGKMLPSGEVVPLDPDEAGHYDVGSGLWGGFKAAVQQGANLTGIPVLHGLYSAIRDAVSEGNEQDTSGVSGAKRFSESLAEQFADRYKRGASTGGFRVPGPMGQAQTTLQALRGTPADEPPTQTLFFPEDHWASKGQSVVNATVPGAAQVSGLLNALFGGEGGMTEGSRKSVERSAQRGEEGVPLFAPMAGADEGYGPLERVFSSVDPSRARLADFAAGYGPPALLLASLASGMVPKGGFPTAASTSERVGQALSASPNAKASAMMAGLNAQSGVAGAEEAAQGGDPAAAAVHPLVAIGGGAALPKVMPPVLEKTGGFFERRGGKLTDKGRTTAQAAALASDTRSVDPALAPGVAARVKPVADIAVRQGAKGPADVAVLVDRLTTGTGQGVARAEAALGGKVLDRATVDSAVDAAVRDVVPEDVAPGTWSKGIETVKTWMSQALSDAKVPGPPLPNGRPGPPRYNATGLMKVLNGVMMEIESIMTKQGVGQADKAIADVTRAPLSTRLGQRQVQAAALRKLIVETTDNPDVIVPDLKTGQPAMMPLSQALDNARLIQDAKSARAIVAESGSPIKGAFSRLTSLVVGTLLERIVRPQALPGPLAVGSAAMDIAKGMRKPAFGRARRQLTRGEFWSKIGRNFTKLGSEMRGDWFTPRDRPRTPAELDAMPLKQELLAGRDQYEDIKYDYWDLVDENGQIATEALPPEIAAWVKEYEAKAAFLRSEAEKAGVNFEKLMGVEEATGAVAEAEAAPTSVVESVPVEPPLASAPTAPPRVEPEPAAVTSAPAAPAAPAAAAAADATDATARVGTATRPGTTSAMDRANLDTVLKGDSETGAPGAFDDIHRTLDSVLTEDEIASGQVEVASVGPALRRAIVQAKRIVTETKAHIDEWVASRSAEASDAMISPSTAGNPTRVAQARAAIKNEGRRVVAELEEHYALEVLTAKDRIAIIAEQEASAAEAIKAADRVAKRNEATRAREDAKQARKDAKAAEKAARQIKAEAPPKQLEEGSGPSDGLDEPSGPAPLPPSPSPDRPLLPPPGNEPPVPPAPPPNVEPTPPTPPPPVALAQADGGVASVIPAEQAPRLQAPEPPSPEAGPTPVTPTPEPPAPTPPAPPAPPVSVAETVTPDTPPVVGTSTNALPESTPGEPPAPPVVAAVAPEPPPAAPRPQQVIAPELIAARESGGMLPEDAMFTGQPVTLHVSLLTNDTGTGLQPVVGNTVLGNQYGEGIVLGQGDVASLNAMRGGRTANAVSAVGIVELKNPLIIEGTVDLTPPAGGGNAVVNDIIRRMQKNGHDGIVLRDATRRYGSTTTRRYENVVIVNDPAKVQVLRTMDDPEARAKLLADVDREEALLNEERARRAIEDPDAEWHETEPARLERAQREARLAQLETKKRQGQLTSEEEAEYTTLDSQLNPPPPPPDAVDLLAQERTRRDALDAKRKDGTIAPEEELERVNLWRKVSKQSPLAAPRPKPVEPAPPPVLETEATAPVASETEAPIPVTPDAPTATKSKVLVTQKVLNALEWLSLDRSNPYATQYATLEVPVGGRSMRVNLSRYRKDAKYGGVRYVYQISTESGLVQGVPQARLRAEILKAVEDAVPVDVPRVSEMEP